MEVHHSSYGNYRNEMYHQFFHTLNSRTNNDAFDLNKVCTSITKWVCKDFGASGKEDKKERKIENEGIHLDFSSSIIRKRGKTK